ncbi:hypothetical protein BGX27_003334 [Mortierella sp. AM989]|nr:hypothetical protein BGX27_003334 [Mortierella sp. AM989]
MSSPLDLIRLTLVELIDEMNGENPDNVDSQAAATNICNMTLTDLKGDEIDMATSLLFNPDKGIMYFLRKALDKSAHGVAKVTFLEFTAEFISRSPNSITPYIRTCLALFLNDSLARVRKASILPIKILLSSCNKMIDPEALDINGLFEKIYEAYGSQQSKMASTVKAEVLEVLGIIARYFPKVAERRQVMIVRWCLTTINDQLKPGAKQELILVAGALVGLDNCLYSFADKATKDVPAILQLIKTLVNVPEDLSRFATPVAALDLFAHHIHLFRPKLIEIYEWMYQRIASYCEHSHNGMSKCGYNSLDVFLQEMASVLTESQITEREYNCFLFFTTNFTQIISTEVIASTAQYKAMSVAIRGYGYFAAPCKHIAPDLLKNLLAQLLRKSSFLVSSNTNEGIDGSSSHLAAFITAYTFVAQVYDEIPELLVTALNQMANAAVVNFTKMSTYARIDCTIAIERLLVMLFHKGEGVLRGFFDKFSYKLLVFTSADISRPTIGASRFDRVVPVDDTNWHSYTIYLFLWRNLFKPTVLSEELGKTRIEISEMDLEKFLCIIYGSIMESFKRLVTLLNLSVSDSEMNIDDEAMVGMKTEDMEPAKISAIGPVSGDVGKMQANCAKDFIIFQNLTEFWQIFLPEIRPDLFARWTFVIGHTLIELSSKNPFVSGFYKMFATCLRVCQSISLFQQDGSKLRKPENEPLDTQRAAALFQKYIREVLARLEQYKDDLLAACLQLVLSSPSALTDSNSVIPPIQLALKLGLGYLPLATVGLEAIERWIDVMDQDNDSWLSQVLPCLNEYLMVQVAGAGDNDGFDGSITKSKHKALDRQSQPYKAIARSASMIISSKTGQSLRELQLRILRLLGRQARHNKLILGQRAIRDGSKKESSDLLAWDPEARLKFKIPFLEMKTELQFDEMLPRIVDLAENSLNRQIKVASCELLHSLMILMIGSSAFRARDAQDPKKSPFHKIFLKVFPALLRLAVDVDQVPRSIYRPMVSQLIHWLTNNAQYENPETIALLNACMDAACDTLGPLRDYGAECLGEFVKWSIKQTSTSSSSGSVNIKSLLKRIYNLASHSNPTKRLGASLIVNRIYRVFREESTLVNQFTMELLYWMLFSLKLAEGDHVGLGTRQQACLAITHLQRIIQVKAAIFIRDSKERRRLPGLEDATLESLVNWLLKETSKPEVEYARMCRTLFDDCVKLLPDAPTPGAWIGLKISHDPGFIASICSGAAHNAETFSQPVAYQKWCSQLATVLSNYIWLLDHTGSSELLMTQLRSTSIFAMSTKFLDKCLLFSKALVQGQMKVPLTPLERRQIMEQNFVTVRKVISFVSLVVSRDLDRGNGVLVEHLKVTDFFGSNFFEVFATCLFNPDSIGNEELLKSEDETRTLRNELEMGLRMLHRLPSDILRSFGEVLMSTITSDDLIPLAVSPQINGQDPIKCKAVIDGLELTQQCGILDSMFEGSSRKASEYIISLYETFMTMQSTQDPLWINYCSALLRLSLSESRCQHRLWQYLLDLENAEHAKMTFLKYAGEINRQLAISFSELTPILSSSAKKNPLVLTIWNEFLDYMFSHPELSVERTTFLDMLTRDYSVLQSIVESLDRDQVSMTITIWKRIIALSPRILRMSKSDAFVNYFFKVFQSFFERDPEKNEYLTLPVMSEAFPILPIFLSYPGARTAEFEAVFSRAILNLMPMSSSEYERGSSKFKDYIAALDLLLRALVASSSISLFKTLMGIAIRESNHPYMEQMQQQISSFALKLPLSKFLEITGHCFDEFIKRTHSDEHRRNIVHQILLPILKIVPPLSVSEFYVLHIARIMGVIKQDQPRLNDVDLRRDFIERECCYDLIHVLYMRLPSEFVNSKESKIVDAFTNGKAVTGKELTVDVFRTANAAKFKQDTNPISPEASALRQDFKRAAYNALAAAILCTQRKEDFFRQFLFRDNEAKKEFVWENIVDLTAKHHFEQILSGPLVKTKLSDLRSKSLNPNRMYSSKYQYISSQYLRDSSLSQSVGMVDDNNVYTDTDDGSSNQRDVGSLESESVTDTTEPKGVDDKSDHKNEEPEHTLELDSINSNPCMKMILLIIKELHSSITPPPKEMAKEESTMPSWMKDIHRKLTNPNADLNIRLFLAKIIINMPEAFEMYAYSWIRPLMKLAMEGESYGEAMNYFVQDLCVLIVVWGESVKLTNTYEDRVLLLGFLSYLMKHCHCEQRQYLLNNIDLIKGVFENWSSIAIVPTTIIYNNFKNIKDEKKNITGIQLLGIVLTHDNPPFYKGPEIDLGTLREEEYYEALVRNIGSSLLKLYTSAAEVCGLILAYMKRHNCMNIDFYDLVTKKLSELLIVKSGPGVRPKSGTVQFLNSLHKVQINFPEITDAFGPRLLFLFPQLLGDERKMALEIFASRAAYLPDLFQSLQGLNFLGCLKHKDEATQFAALSIIYGLWESLKAEQILYFLDTIVLEFSAHSSVECRKLYYSILMVLFDRRIDVPAVSNVLRTQLLRGLGDPSESIRHTVVEFWYGKGRLPTNTFLRLGEIVRNMYDAEAEDKFLNYATYMLLDRTKKSSDYSEPIFQESLPNAKFGDSYARIDTSWRYTTAMTPLFVNTQQSQSQAVGNDGTLGDDELRATQSTFDFSMTLDRGAPGIRTQLGGASSSSSTLLFNNPNQDPGAIPSQLSSTSGSQKYRRLQFRRVHVNEAVESQYYKRAYESKVQSRMQSSVDKEIARARSVSMIRKYRDGDLPDIQIPYSDIIQPLQNLAEMDVEICRMLFSRLVTSLISQVDSHMEMEEEAISFKQGLIGDFGNILQKSTILYTPFIGSILRICHDFGEANMPPELIAKVAVRSSNQHLGIILIEKQIQEHEPREKSAKRQKTSVASSHDPKRGSWIELARIYKSVDEKDIFKSIYESKVATTEFTREAIEAEVVGDYDRAVKVYFDGITKHFANEVHVDDAEQSIWAHGRLECLEHLGDWDYLEANMMSDLDNDPQELWTEDYQDPYLHYFLTSYIKLVDGKREDEMLELWSIDKPNPLFQFVDDAMNNPQHRQILVAQYQPELALTAVIRKDFKQASHYVRRSYDRFLSVWSNLHPLSEKPRLHELANLQRIVEMEEFLGSVDAALRAPSGDSLTSLLLKWGRRFPDTSTDTMITWSNVLDDRKLMIQRLDEHLPYSKKNEIIVSKHRIHSFMKMSAAARDQGNFYVANTCIASMQQLQASSYDIYYNRMKLDLAKAQLEMDHNVKADSLIDTLSKFEESTEIDREFDAAQVVGLNVLGIEAYSILRDLLIDDGEVYNHIKSNEWVRRLLRSNASGAGFAQELQRRGFECLQSASAMETSESMTKKLRLTTATYCDKILRHHEGEETDENKKALALSSKDLFVYANHVIKNALLSIRDGEPGAVELFPRLLQIIEIYPSGQKLFTELVSDFPGYWTFVRWIQQMVAVLDKPIGACVMPILRSIASQYPNALYYPLTISAENYSFERNPQGERRKADVDMLKKSVSSPLKEDFIFELRRLTNPDHLLKDWLEQTVALFQSKSRDTERVMALYQDLHRLILDVNNPRLGSIAKAFASKFGSRLEAVCGKTGQKLATISNRDFNTNILKFCRNEILAKDAPKKQSDADLLKAYSPWLHSFQSSDHDGTIDIPGQFTGLSPPNGQQTATIVRFDQRVLVMSSIRKPKRICILGSDEKEHLFLVKGGEDLRLDQRIQQLFSLMNDIMKKDPQCSQQNISVGTYKVIPMSGSLGILEWVDNTKPLRHCIEGEVAHKETWRKTQEQYNKFVASFKGDMMGYHNLFMQGSREKVVKHMESLYSHFREDYLRQSIARLAASPEAFLMLRSEFAKSLAAINVCSYILGIGDRHLENFLLDMSNGCLIPIDFGHAFGSATEVLPVPELAPFRLTRQLESFLNPLGTKGLLEHPMVCIMKALQSKKEIILNTMDVFVKEPLLDWRKYAINQAKEQKKRGADMESFEIDEDSTAPPAWYLQQKMDIARMKLEGYNPSYLTVMELNMGHANKAFLPALSKITLGDKQHNIRARHGRVCTSVQGQIECLIDMATDLDILGRAWVGWMSWVKTNQEPVLKISAPVSTASTTATAPAAATSTANTLSTKPSLPKTYFVERTKSGQLPVYSEFKNAGSRPLTIIRKIEGNAAALRTDMLATYPRVEVRVNERNNQVILKGLVMDDVRQWLTAKGF